MEYPVKIILAWGEAISGNEEIRDWLIKNGYPELGLFSFALRNKQDARDWLLKNKFPHLMALINATEGLVEARKWLQQHNFHLLLLIALAADNDDAALEELKKLGQKEWAIIALKIRSVKNRIERENNDIHKISPE
ncbi:MAG: hypothetical protein HRT74_00930 [Flavobacteriales bacterium]|nr:hypothetical protein [Flavobacteriales bacterium]